jgi:hypothetical protein
MQQQIDNEQWWKSEQQVKTFRLSYLWVFAFYLGSLGLAYFLHPFYHGGIMPPTEFFRLLFSFAVASFLLYVWFPVRVGERGIQGHNCFGLPLRFRWEEIDKVSLFHMGLPWLRIAPKKRGWAIYMPAFLQEKAQFYQEIQQWIPPENPLRQYLEARATKT